MPRCVRIPQDGNPAFWFASPLPLCDRAFFHVNHESMPETDSADDGIAWQGAATRRELNCLAFIAMNKNGCAGN